MANSIELRTPLLDHRLLEQAALLPDRHKLSFSKTKIVLKDAFRSKIPKEILKRAKRGFSTPIDLWLSRSGNELTDIFLNQKGLIKEIFKKEAVESLFKRHKRGEGDYSASILTLIVLCFWFSIFMNDR